VISKLLVGFCCAAATTLLASIVLVEMVAPDQDEHLAFTHLLEERRALDQDVARHALEARFQFAANYDQLARDELDGRSLQTDASLHIPGFLRESERKQLKQAFTRYTDLASERQSLLEHFKSHNALLKSSVSYFPTLTSTLLEQNQSLELLEGVAELSSKTLSLAIRQDPALADAQRRARDNVAKLAETRLGDADKRTVQLMLAHARTISIEKAQADATLSKLLTLPMATRRGDVASTYQRAYARAGQQARLLGHVVSAFAVALLSLLTCAGLRLRAATKALSRSHDRLELAVTTRTAELREEMARREHMELELRHAQKLEAVGQLAAGIAHEINTPIQYVGDSLYFLREAFGDVLRLIEGYEHALSATALVDHHRLLTAAQRIEEDVDMTGLKSEIPEAFERALDGTRQVTHIVQAMKTFSHTSPDKAPLDLNKAIENTLTVARNEYRFVADLVVELGELPSVTCHAAGIRQVLLNLIVNAAHAVADVVVKSQARGQITIRTQHRGDAVTIAVNDTGTGIPELARERVFDPFFTTKPPGKGSGQGLAISKSIVDQHGGKLWFETTLNQGTTFFLELPVQARETRADASATRAA
jgi:signal transduction histidine kinase